ncbi:hypothetical protein K2173_020236 [Erythroxylum novogranatense]|uniref:Fumarate reductase/succinate dehydrogenase flavoprotein-like C-terminal domain-containing protein n=1 Tax=Erythroxylum novogranatense TaxID=1862640 RepID=A0AAV8U798_9ROSI|nr:hypothetical protein K2173_020236 [Erythroxylum novogranatense]
MKSSKLDHSVSNCWPRPIAPNALGSQAMDDILKTTKKVRKELQLIMWQYVGIVRSTIRLQTAEEKISELENNWERCLFQKGWEQTMVGLEACEMRNLFCCAKLVVSSALARHESRGLHYTIDYPHVEESKRPPTVHGVPDSCTSRPFVRKFMKTFVNGSIIMILAIEI